MTVCTKLFSNENSHNTQLQYLRLSCICRRLQQLLCAAVKNVHQFHILSTDSSKNLISRHDHLLIILFIYRKGAAGKSAGAEHQVSRTLMSKKTLSNAEMEKVIVCLHFLFEKPESQETKVIPQILIVFYLFI